MRSMLRASLRSPVTSFSRRLLPAILIGILACSVDVVVYPDEPTDGPYDAPPGDAPPVEVSLVVSATQLTVNEAAQVTFTVALSARPASQVLISLTPSNADKLGLSPPALMIQPADFATPRTIVLTGREDDDTVDEQQSVVIQSPGMASATIQVAISDNDGLGLIASPGTSLEITEGTTETLGLRLSAQPVAPMSATLRSSNPQAAMPTPATVTFTPENWDVEQLVTISGPNDANTSDDLANLTIAGNGLVDISVAVKVFDDDVLGIEPSSTNLGALTEGGNRTFTVRLMQPPTAMVQVGVASSDPDVLTAAQSSLTFTPANWSTPQAVQVSSLHDDDTAGGAASIRLTATGLALRTVVSTVIDDDTQLITASPSSLSVGEGAAADLDVRLAFRPATAVTIAAATLAPAMASVTPASITFTPADYATPQRLTVTAMEDADAAPGSTTVRLEQVATGLVTDVAINIIENDTLTIETTPSALSLVEGGSATFGVRLTAMPLTDVTVALSSSDPSAAVATPSPLFFNSTNWSTYQTVAVTGIQDVDLANESVTIALAASGLSTKSVTAAISDDDSQQLVVSTTNVAVTEGGTATVGVSLQYQPSANVTVTVVSSLPGSASVPASLTFSPATYAAVQSLVITGVQDSNIVNETATITLASSGIPSVAITANITDNDTLAIETSAASVSVGEGATTTFQVRLNAQPSATITVSLASNDSSAATISPATLTFTTANWNTFQAVTVTGVEDADVLNETAAILLSTPGLANANVGVTVTDNDTLSILTSSSAISLGEATTGSFGVRLGAQPAGNITVTVTSANPGAAIAAPPTLTFTPVNWNTDQPVTVSGVTDSDVANESVAITCSSPGLTSRVVTATVTDDDTQVVEVNVGTVNLAEGGTGTFNVWLRYQPAGSVTVAVTSNNATAATAAPSTLTFTTANYAAVQTVTVTGVQDANATPETATITASAAGATSGVVQATVTDDDTQAIIVSTTSVSLSEGGSATFTVRLAAQPPAATSVSISSGDTGAATASPSALSFTSSDWSTPQTITVTGVADLDLVNESVQITCSSPPLPSQTITATVADDDTQVVQVSPSSMSINEGGTGTFGVTLRFQPTGNVTINVTSANTAIAGVSTGSLTFTPSNYAVAQNVTVTGTQDPNAAPDATTITASLNAATPGAVSVTVNDDDTMAIAVSTTSLSVSESGSASFSVSLSAQPLSNFTVAISSGNPSAVSASPPSLTFTPANWNGGQTVTVSGVNDANSNHETVTVTASNGALSRNVSVTVADDDLLSLGPDTTVCEGLGTSVSVSLNGAPPGGSMSVAISSSPLLSTFTSSLFFAGPGTQDVTVFTSLVPSSQSASLVFSAPGQTARTFSVTILDSSTPGCPFCGDGVCNGLDNSSNCPEDCPRPPGECPTGGDIPCT